MARQRTLKPEFFRDRLMARLGPVVALVYQALWCWADDGGVARIEPDLLKGEAFARWTDITHGVLIEALVSLHGARRIRPYAVGDELFASIPMLEKHSQIQHPSKFRLPRGGQEVTDIKAWLSGQLTHGGLNEGSYPSSRMPLAVSLTASSLHRAREDETVPEASGTSDPGPWPDFAKPTAPPALLPPAYAPALERAMKASRNPGDVEAVVRDTIANPTSTMPKHHQFPAEVVGQALQELMATSSFSAAGLRAFCQRIARERTAPLGATPATSGTLSENLGRYAAQLRAEEAPAA